jgi:hypothetical protein
MPVNGEGILILGVGSLSDIPRLDFLRFDLPVVLAVAVPASRSLSIPELIQKLNTSMSELQILNSFDLHGEGVSFQKEIQLTIENLRREPPPLIKYSYESKRRGKGKKSRPRYTFKFGGPRP